MKTNFHIPTSTLFIAANILFASCNKEELEQLGVNAQLTLNYENIELIIPATEIQGEIDMAVGFNVAELQDLVAGQGYSIDQVKEVRFLAANIRMQTPYDATFDALGHVNLRMIYGGQQMTIASVPNVPQGASELVLQMDGSDLTELFLHNDAELRVTGSIVGPVTEDLHTRCNLSFKVVVESGS